MILFNINKFEEQRLLGPKRGLMTGYFYLCSEIRKTYGKVRIE